MENKRLKMIDSIKVTEEGALILMTEGFHSLLRQLIGENKNVQEFEKEKIE